jgi:hypothetical protein
VTEQTIPGCVVCGFPEENHAAYLNVDHPFEVRSVSSTGGEKGTKEERYDLIPTEALALVAKLYGFGAKKYAEHNWRRGYEWSKSYAAMRRHEAEFWRGVDLDPETGLPHLAAVVFHALTLMTFMEEQRSFDDRFKAEGSETSEYSEEYLANLREKLRGAPVVQPQELTVEEAQVKGFLIQPRNDLFTDSTGRERCGDPACCIPTT